ncbi:hypothetical protein ACWEQL_24585 [Kitasatospora sp. NPDC004240]
MEHGGKDARTSEEREPSDASGRVDLSKPSEGRGEAEETAAPAQAPAAGAVDGTGAVEDAAPAERELSKGAAAVATVVAAVLAAGVLLALFHLMGFSVPLVGWLLAKGAIKVAAFGVFGCVGLVAWLRQRRSGPSEGA